VRAGRIVAYPFLAAIYPVVALASANAGELVRLRDLVRPLAISVVAALAAWLLSRMVTQDRHGRAFLAFIAAIVFSTAGYAAAFLNRWVPLGLALLLVAAPPVAVAAILAKRGRISFHPLTRYLNVVLAILLLWCVASFAWRLRPGKSVARLEDFQSMSAADTSHGPKPHFFLIILDQYTGARSLNTNYGFDNTPFERVLESYGFVVPRAARANYVHTFLALGAMLNWEYLDDVADRLGRGNRDWAAAYPLVEDNRTWRLLHRLGYRFVFLPTALPATDHNRYADLQLPDPSQLTREFESVWLRGTILLPMLESVCPAVGCLSSSIPYVPESAQSIDWKFATIPSLAESDKPLFVLAHLTVPHEPYLYDADCSHRKPYWPMEAKKSEEAAVTGAYVAQVQCVNLKVEELVRGILGRSTRPAIIVLQADHGYGRPGVGRTPLSRLDPKRVEERTDIFAAYRLPGAPPGLIYDSIGPVNAMRAVMRFYYGVDLPPLPEASYWSPDDHPYQFTRVP